MNVVVLVGRLTNDPVLRTTQTGTNLANFTIAVPRRFKRDNQPDADFINCTAWGKTGEVISQYLSKGRQIAVQGRIQTSSYQDQSGAQRYRTDVIVENFDFIGSRSDSSNNNYNQSSQSNNYNNYNQNSGNQSVAPLEIDDDFSLLDEDDDIPF